MTDTNKVKVSVTLSRDLLERIDREAAAGDNRSAVVERWLRLGSRQATARAIDDATAAYYEGLARDEREEDAAIARGSSRAARKVRYDDVEPAGRRSARG